MKTLTIILLSAILLIDSLEEGDTLAFIWWLVIVVIYVVVFILEIPKPKSK